MYIQSLLPSVLPVGVGSVSRVRTGRARPEPASQAKPVRGDSPRIDRRDTVEISRQAEAQFLGQLSDEARRVVEKLKARDREVRAHEQAHTSAAGPYARGGASFSYQTGPDGRRYAVGGEVSIDASPVPDDPEATIRKAQVVRSAALAPANPSAQDRSVAAAATKMETLARQEFRQQQIEQKQQEEPSGEYGNGPLVVSGATHSRNRQEAVGSLLDAVA